MDVQAINELVYEAKRTLVNEGRFPETWWANYQSAIEFSRGSFKGIAWPRALFLPLHFASTHLVLRYNVWSASSNVRNAESELTLEKVQFVTEEWLWSALTDIPHWRADSKRAKGDTALGDDERRLLELCFGNDSPVGDIVTDCSFHPWKEKYEACLHEIAVDYRKRDSWPKWVCVAVHFAAYYIDLFQLRTVVLSESDECISQRVAEIDLLITRLRSQIHNGFVLLLIKLWLCSTGTRRDASGLPTIGGYRRRREQFISVRTCSELFLQTCGHPLSF